VRGEPTHPGHEILSRKTKDIEAAQSEDFVMLGVNILIQCQGVTDGWTNGQTVTLMTAKTREA